MANSGNGWTSPYATTSAASLTSGTLPDARFPATLPAASGANLTALNATQLTSGTVPDARLNSTLQATTSGTYTPTLTAVANCSGLTSNVAQWLRVGNTVTVSGLLAGTETSVATLCKIGIALPVASAFTGVAQCAGGGGVLPTSGNVQGLYVTGDATNDRAEVNWKANGSSTAFNLSYTFTYAVI